MEHIYLWCVSNQTQHLFLVGRKKFILFPGDVTPPGVTKIDDDNFEAPTTIMKWFVEQYHYLEEGMVNYIGHFLIFGGTFLEAIVHPGEMIYVPSGWWHTVLNMDETIAVTQNFVDHVNLPDVCSYLKFHKPELHANFLEGLKTLKPEVYESYNENFGEKKSEWDKMMEGNEEDGEDFCLF